MNHKSEPGSIVRVIYGECNVTEEEDTGYSYRCGESVGIGDIVLVPPTSLDIARGINFPKTATVVSLQSDYEEPVDSIWEILKRRNPVETPVDSTIDAIDAIKAMDHPEEIVEYEITPIGFDMIEVTADGESLGFAGIDSEELVKTLVERLNDTESSRHEAQYRKREADIVCLLNSNRQHQGERR